MEHLILKSATLTKIIKIKKNDYLENLEPDRNETIFGDMHNKILDFV